MPTREYQLALRTDRSDHRRRRSGSAVLTAVIVLGCVVGLISLSAAQPSEVNWYDKLEDAQAAAEEAGKPIYLFIFLLEHGPGPCRRMHSETLVDPRVVEFLNTHFICCALDAAIPHNREMVDRHARSIAEDEGNQVDTKEGKVRWGSMPAHAFVNARNEPYLTFWGYMPAPAFLLKLKQAREIIRLKNALNESDDDPVTHARLGHELLEFGDYKHAREHLEKAKKLDPENRAGALEDVTLDLIVLDIADKPEQSYQQLVDFLRRFPGSDRELEVKYWKAVALAAQQTRVAYKKALNELRLFDKLSPDDPRYRSRWAIAADKLRQMLETSLRSGE